MTFYAYDTEFLEDGKAIHLISIGIVASDGREYYAVNLDMPAARITQNDWLLDNVWPHLPLKDYRYAAVGGTGIDEERKVIHAGTLDQESEFVKPKWVIRNEVRAFLTNPSGALWADHGAYDHVVLAQLFGRMIDLPDGIPMFTNDLQTALAVAGPDFKVPERGPFLNEEHNALHDAAQVMRTLRDLGMVDETSHV